MNSKRKILIIDDNPDLREIIRRTLQKEKFKIIESNDALDGIQKAVKEKPDLVLLDVMLPEMDGFEVCAILKGKRETTDIPVIFLSARDHIKDKVRGLDLGGVDYIPKPFRGEELTARIKSLMRTRDHDIALNPLSKLPGNKMIEEKIYALIKKKEEFAVAYLDVDNFKAYNDKYGFFKGDEVLLSLANLIGDAIEKYGSPDDFLGHIGGDDFIFLSKIKNVERICKKIIKDFENNKSTFYYHEDLENGFIETIDRIGIASKIPLMTLSISVITNKNRNIRHPGEMVAIATELKNYLKTLPGSNYKIDRRSSGETPKEFLDKRRIMLIEPNNEIAQKFDEVLEGKDIFIRYVENGASALLLMDSLRPNLILMNSNLPLIDGLTLFGQIKKNKELSKIPVYIYSKEPFHRLVTKGEVNIPPDNFIDLNDLKNSLTRILDKTI